MHIRFFMHVAFLPALFLEISNVHTTPLLNVLWQNLHAMFVYVAYVDVPFSEILLLMLCPNIAIWVHILTNINCTKKRTSLFE